MVKSGIIKGGCKLVSGKFSGVSVVEVEGCVGKKSVRVGEGDGEGGRSVTNPSVTCSVEVEGCTGTNLVVDEGGGLEEEGGEEGRVVTMEVVT